MLAAGTVAGAGTLGIMIPPSTIMIIYGVFTETNIGKLFAAGVLPGILGAILLCLAILYTTWRHPGWGPPGPRSSWRERWTALKDVWATLLLFVFAIGGLYGGLFTPTEAGGMGAGGAFLIGVARGRLKRPDIRRSLLQATRTAAAVFTVLIGALLFGYFLTITQTPQKVTAFLTGLGLGSYGVLVLILSAQHGYFVRWARDFATDQNRHSQKFYRIVNEIPTILMIGIVLLAVVKPF